MKDNDIIKLKEKIEDFICLQLADDIDDYEDILDKLVSMFMEGYKQLSIEEIREKFEKFLYQACIPTIRNSFPKSVHGKYKFSTDQIRWEAYLQVYKDLGLIKE